MRFRKKLTFFYSKFKSISAKTIRLILCKRLEKKQSVINFFHLGEIDPRIFNYYLDHFIIISAPVNKAFGFYFFGLDNQIFHPFYIALKKFKSDTKNALKDFENTLQKYYDLTKGYNLQGYLDVELSNGVADLPPHALSFPWDSKTPSEALNMRKNRVGTKDNFYGFNRLGEVSPKLITDEAKRVLSIHNSILEKGYQPNNSTDFISGTFLFRDNDWRWIVGSGDHRLPVLMFHNIQNIPVRIVKLVRRQEVDFWPNVRNGIYSKKSALEIFDRYFSNSYSKVFQNWINQCINEKL